MGETPLNGEEPVESQLTDDEIEELDKTSGVVPLSELLDGESDSEEDPVEEPSAPLPGETLEQSLFRRFPYLKEVHYRILSSSSDLAKYLEGLRPGQSLTIDLETSGLDPEKDHIVGVALTYAEREGVYVPIAHTVRTELNVPWEQVRDILNKVLVDRAGRFFNYKFDGAFLAAAGVTVPKWEECWVCTWMRDPDNKKHGLKSQTKIILGIQMINIFDLFPEMTPKRGKKKQRIPFETVDPCAATQYACGDVDFTQRLWNLGEAVRKEQDIWKVENRIPEVLRIMEGNKAKIHTEYLLRIDKELVDRIEWVKKRIIHQIGEVDIDSPKKLGQRLFVEMKIPNPERTKNGQIATGEDVLKKLKGTHPVLGDILQYRSLAKCRSTYILNILAGVGPDGRAKFCFRQCAAPTGRFAAGKDKEGGGGGDIEAGYAPVNAQAITKAEPAEVDAWELTEYDRENPCIFSDLVEWDNPNSARICRRKDCPCIVEGRSKGIWREGDDRVTFWETPNIRKAFIGEPGTKIVAIDYSGVELRIATNLSGERVWIEEYAKPDADLHRASARSIFAKHNVSKKERSLAKTVNFAMLFGGSGHAVARQIDGMTVDEGKKLVDKFNKALPTFHAWVKRTHKEAQANKFVWTKFGRKRLLNMYNSPKFKDIAFGNRSSVSTKVQGTAADIMKIALVRLWGDIQERGWQKLVKMLLTVHDECVFEIAESILSEAIPVLVKAMAFHIKEWPVQLVCDIEVGPSWGEKEEYRLVDGKLVLHEDISKAAQAPPAAPPEAPKGPTSFVLLYRSIISKENLEKLRELIRATPGATPISLRFSSHAMDVGVEEKVDLAPLLSKAKGAGLLLTAENCLAPS